MTEHPAKGGMSTPKRRIRRPVLAAVLVVWVATGVWQTSKPLPPGTDVDSGDIGIAADHIEFLHDLTYLDRSGNTVREQEIFDAVMEIVDAAESFAVLDFFLFNDQAGNAGASPRALSRELTDRLLARKRERPALQILVITDAINDVYGGAPSPLLLELAQAGIEVVRTDLTVLRDSNPAYSSLWRMFVQWWGNSPAISWLPNPFADGPERISLRSWLSLLNFKANHRKVIVADGANGTWSGLITSANPHDASSGHSNVAVRFTGPAVAPVLASEIEVARFSGWTGTVPNLAATPAENEPEARAAFVTEEAIRRRLLAAIGASDADDAVDIAMFYLADRKIVTALLEAADRGAAVRLILDPNKDAFGIEKDGVPNRPVANELVEASEGRIGVRWYQTHGEQFHAKLVIVRRPDRVLASLGSANLTRRNIGNYNLEANLELDLPPASPVAAELIAFYDRLWTNDELGAYTLPFTAYEDDSPLRYWRYRLMEATGLSTF